MNKEVFNSGRYTNLNADVLKFREYDIYGARVCGYLMSRDNTAMALERDVR